MKRIFTVAPLFLLSACGFEIVDTGFRGVETNMGKVVSESLPEGLYFYNPLTSNITELDVRTQHYESETQVYTKDVQQAMVKVVVNFNLEKNKAHLMFQDIGQNWSEVLIPQYTNGALKAIIGKWDAVDLVSNRDKATAQITAELQKELEARFVTISSVQLANIDFAEEFEKAVEAKVTAIQRASEAENKTKQISEEAKQKVITAKAEAEAMKIKSEALSQNQSLVQYEAVLKWNGILPQYMLGDSTPFINLAGAK